MENMRATVLAVAVSFVVMLVVVKDSQGDQILPEPLCMYCALLFRSQGCLDKETPLCKVLALKFTLNLRGDKLCDRFLCNPGYGRNETGTSCTGLLGCPVSKLRLTGICSTNQVCCAN